MAATAPVAEVTAAAALRSVLYRVRQAAERSGRRSEDARVIAVGKTKPASHIRHVYDAGHRCFGENYVQEIIDKAPQLPEDIEWHFIGHLQSNKVKSLLAAVPNLATVHGVDNEKIANHLERAVVSLGRKPLKVLVQVNTSGEASKSGIDPSGCVELVKHVKQGCPNLEFSGLMTIGMPDYSSTPDNFRGLKLSLHMYILDIDGASLISRQCTNNYIKDFVKKFIFVVGSRKSLSNCRVEVCKALGIAENKCELSMGMSADFEQAIEMGSTYVRIGSTIFGPRIYPNKKE